MIPFKLQLLLMVGALLCAVLLFNLIRKYKLELKYTMLWLVMMFIILILSIFPNLVEIIARVVDIQAPVNALFLLVSFSALAILFSITVTTSRASTKVKALSQEVGLLKLELKKLLENGENQKKEQ